MSCITEDILYSILQYNSVDYDYSSLFNNPAYKERITSQYYTQCNKLCNELIIEHFSRLYYLDAMVGPPSRAEVDNVFRAMDYYDVFEVPNYYDISTYMQVFSEFEDYAFASYCKKVPYYQHISKEKIYKPAKSSSNLDVLLLL